MPHTEVTTTGKKAWKDKRVNKRRLPDLLSERKVDRRRDEEMEEPCSVRKQEGKTIEERFISGVSEGKSFLVVRTKAKLLFQISFIFRQHMKWGIQLLT